MEVNVQVLASLFHECSCSDFVKIRAAEKHLIEAEKHPHFISSIFQVVEATTLPDAVRQLAAIYFKNHVKKLWDVPEESGGIRNNDRALVKSKGIDLIIASSGSRPIQSQLSSAIQLVAMVDFPADWKNFLPDLVKNYILNDGGGLKSKCAAVEIADAVLEKYRKEERCNEVLAGLKYDVLPHIEQPLLTIFTEAVKHLLLMGPNCPKSSELEDWFRLAHYSSRIFYSLVSIDLPEFFEDHKEEFFSGFLALLDYQNINLSGKANDIEGPLEELKSEQCRIFTIFAQRYCEEFEPIVIKSVGSVLRLLLTEDIQALYLDGLVSRAMQFLGAIGRYKWNPCPFSDPPTRLAEICQHVIVPNIQLRDSDIELLEDNPQEFIRRDLEGSESDTRRGAAVELVNALSQCYDTQVSRILAEYVARLLGAAADAPPQSLQRQKLKDAAVYLVIALVVKAQSRAFGVAEVRSSINIADFFTQIGDEIIVTPSTKQHLDNVLIRTSTLKFISTFRNQLDKTTLLRLLPEIVNNLSLENPVVHTHAAYCLENVLAARDIPTQPLIQTEIVTTNRGVLKFNTADLKLPLLTALESILQRIKSQEGIRENEYLMRCVMKILIYLHNEASSVILQTLETLRDVLRSQCNGSSNPLFSHYLFESISVAAKTCSSIGRHTDAEACLLETLSTIVTQPEHDFTPYALQVMGLLLDTADVASPLYLNLLDHLLEPTQWSASVAKVPGIVRVLSALFRKQEVFKDCLKARFETIMLRFQYCLNHKRLCSVAFDLLNDALHYLPICFFSPFLHPLILTLLKRLQMSQTPKLSQQVAFSLSLLNCRSETIVLPKLLNLTQPGLANDFLINVYIPSVKIPESLYQKKVGLLGVAKLCTTPEVLENSSLLAACLETCATLMGVVTKEDSSRNKSIPTETFICATDITYGKQEEFQGSFNVLQAAKISLSTKELQEVSTPVFLQNVRRCFDNTELAARAQGVQAWNQMVALLAAAG